MVFSADLRSRDDVSISLNKPRTVPSCPEDLGNSWAGGSADVPQSPLTVDFEKNSREVIRVSIETYQGALTINIRTWWRDGDELKPGRAGLSVAVKHLPALATALDRVLAQAVAGGIVDDAGAR